MSYYRDFGSQGGEYLSLEKSSKHKLLLNVDSDIEFMESSSSMLLDLNESDQETDLIAQNSDLSNSTISSTFVDFLDSDSLSSHILSAVSEYYPDNVDYMKYFERYRINKEKYEELMERLKFSGILFEDRSTVKKWVQNLNVSGDSYEKMLMYFSNLKKVNHTILLQKNLESFKFDVLQEQELINPKDAMKLIESIQEKRNQFYSTFYSEYIIEIEKLLISQLQRSHFNLQNSSSKNSKKSHKRLVLKWTESLLNECDIIAEKEARYKLDIHQSIEDYIGTHFNDKWLNSVSFVGTSPLQTIRKIPDEEDENKAKKHIRRESENAVTSVLKIQNDFINIYDSIVLFDNNQRERMKTMLDAKVVVSVVGEINSGKSTFVETFLETFDMLNTRDSLNVKYPVCIESIDPMQPSEENPVKYWFGKLDDKQRIVSNSKKDLLYQLKTPISPNTGVFGMMVKNEYLNYCTVIDNSGFKVRDSNDTKIAKNVANRDDLVVLVLNAANNPIIDFQNLNMVETMLENISRRGKEDFGFKYNSFDEETNPVENFIAHHFLIVCNKTDCLSGDKKAKMKNIEDEIKNKLCRIIVSNQTIRSKLTAGEVKSVEEKINCLEVSFVSLGDAKISILNHSIIPTEFIKLKHDVVNKIAMLKQNQLKSIQEYILNSVKSTLKIIEISKKTTVMNHQIESIKESLKNAKKELEKWVFTSFKLKNILRGVVKDMIKEYFERIRTFDGNISKFLNRNVRMKVNQCIRKIIDEYEPVIESIEKTSFYVENFISSSVSKLMHEETQEEALRMNNEIIQKQLYMNQLTSNISIILNFIDVNIFNPLFYLDVHRLHSMSRCSKRNKEEEYMKKITRKIIESIDERIALTINFSNQEIKKISCVVELIEKSIKLKEQDKDIYDNSEQTLLKLQKEIYLYSILKTNSSC